jgi:hypothetical protein
MNIVTLAQQEPIGGGGAGGAVVSIVYLVVLILVLAGIWKSFAKAGQPGWASIIPIYNLVVLLQIAGKPIWWILLMLIPIVNLIVAIMVMVAVAQKFGKGAGFGLGLAFLGFIFWPILGFGDATYQESVTPTV